MDIIRILQQQEVRPGRPYYSPAHIVSADSGMYGVPYTVLGPMPFMAMLGVTISAPPLAKKTPTPHTAQAISNQAVIGVGQAPTSGIYTGVEDHCG